MTATKGNGKERVMDVEQARDFVRRNSRAVVGTYRRDGRAQLAPVRRSARDVRPPSDTRPTGIRRPRETAPQEHRSRHRPPVPPEDPALARERSALESFGGFSLLERALGLPDAPVAHDVRNDV